MGERGRGQCVLTAARACTVGPIPSSESMATSIAPPVVSAFTTDTRLTSADRRFVGSASSAILSQGDYRDNQQASVRDRWSNHRRGDTQAICQKRDLLQITL